MNDVTKETEEVKQPQPQKSVREPLFHVVKRDALPVWKALLIRVGAILIGTVVCSILFAITMKENPLDFFVSIFEGCFKTERRIWILLRDTSLLLLVSMALVPAFRMKFWNLGGNGQILMGCLATTACMFYLGGKWPDGVVIPLMIVSGILAGMVWALIPAIFKAFFKTNESLFTLMMNYLASGIVVGVLKVWVKSGSGTLPPIGDANLPEIGNQYLLTILVAVLITALMYVYLRFSKQGYEISVVGESENTARYIGINVRKVVIRTLAISGAICGLTGLLLSGAINHNITSTMDDNMGFTAIMAAWLGKFNPLVIVATSFFINFIDKGVGQVNTDFGLTNSAFSEVAIGIIYFFIIGCEFFIQYKIRRNAGKSGGEKSSGKVRFSLKKLFFRRREEKGGEE